MPQVSMGRLRHSAAALELAFLRYRGGVRRRLGLGDDELSVLLFLLVHGAVPQGRIRGITTLSRSGTGALIHRLEDDGYLERQTDTSDRRTRVVALSTGGRARIEGAYRALDEATVRLARRLGPNEADALARLLDLLTEAADSSGDELGEPLRAANGDPIWRRWA